MLSTSLEMATEQTVQGHQKLLSQRELFVVSSRHRPNKRICKLAQNAQTLSFAFLVLMRFGRMRRSHYLSVNLWHFSSSQKPDPIFSPRIRYHGLKAWMRLLLRILLYPSVFSTRFFVLQKPRRTITNGELVLLLYLQSLQVLPLPGPMQKRLYACNLISRNSWIAIYSYWPIQRETNCREKLVAWGLRLVTTLLPLLSQRS